MYAYLSLAHACYSCRAFFRRTVEKKEVKSTSKFYIKNNNNAPLRITKYNRNSDEDIFGWHAKLTAVEAAPDWYAKLIAEEEGLGSNPTS